MIAVPLSDKELDMVFERASSRNRVKVYGGVRTKKIAPRAGDVEIHYIGLKAELALAKLLDLEVNWEHTLQGDGHKDFLLLDKVSVDVKSSRRDLFMCPDCLKADMAILANPLTSPAHDKDGNIVVPRKDPRVKTKRDLFGWADVFFVGWTGNKRFRQLAKRTNFGYGPLLLMQREQLLPMDRVVDGVRKWKEGNEQA